MDRTRFPVGVASNSAKVCRNMDLHKKKYKMSIKTPAHTRSKLDDRNEDRRNRCQDETKQMHVATLISCSSCRGIFTEDAYISALLAEWQNGGCIHMAVCAKCIITNSPEYFNVVRTCQQCHAKKTLREFGPTLCAIVLRNGEEHPWQWRCSDCQYTHCRKRKRRKSFKTPPSPS